VSIAEVTNMKSFTLSLILCFVADAQILSAFYGQSGGWWTSVVSCGQIKQTLKTLQTDYFIYLRTYLLT